MALTNHERVGKALDLLRAGLSPFVERELKAKLGKDWVFEAREALSDTRLAAGKGEPLNDVAAQLVVMDRKWGEVFRLALGKAERPAEPQKPGAPSPQPPCGERSAPEPPKPAAGPRRYHGSVALDPARVGRDVGRIAEEVIAHLAGLVGAEVAVTLEIEARIPGGPPDNVVRIVTENGRTLKFASHGFEKE
jgi:hypothetical protein